MIPKRGTFSTVVLPVLALAVVAVIGVIVTSVFGFAEAWFGPHIWVILVIVAALLGRDAASSWCRKDARR